VKKVLRWFLALQAVGLVGILLYLAFPDSAVGIVSARLALVALFPGSLVSGRLVEWLLWPRSMSRETIQALATFSVFVINAFGLALFIFAVRFRARHPAA
jgi:hypothetical protein